MSDIFHVDRGYPGFDVALRHLGADVTREPDPDAAFDALRRLDLSHGWPSSRRALDLVLAEHHQPRALGGRHELGLDAGGLEPLPGQLALDEAARRGDGHHQPVVVGGARTRPALDQRAPLAAVRPRSSSASTPTMTIDVRSGSCQPGTAPVWPMHRPPVRLGAHEHLHFAVIGAGLMGSGIAQVAAAGGQDVVLRDVTDEALARGTAAIKTSFDRFVAQGQPRGDGRRRRPGPDHHDHRPRRGGADADIVVEAVFEKLEVKHEIFRALDKLCRDGAVLATNTSAIPITKIAAVTERPEAVVGTHFFSPVPMMQLCELVRGYKTSDETLPRAREFAESVGKTCIVVNRDVAGFVTTRLISALAIEATRLYETGVASAEDIDTACKLGFGHAMGPLATTDLTGVDILRTPRSNIYTESQDEKFSPPELLRRMVAAGDLGRKTGQGFYTYDG